MGKHWAPTDLTFTRQLETGSACVAGCGSFGCGPQHSAGHVRLRTREVTWIGAAAGGFHKATPKWVNEWFIIENPIKILLKCMISGGTRMDWKPPYGPHPTLGSRHPGWLLGIRKTAPCGNHVDSTVISPIRQHAERSLVSVCNEPHQATFVRLPVSFGSLDLWIAEENPLEGDLSRLPWCDQDHLCAWRWGRGEALKIPWIDWWIVAHWVGCCFVQIANQREVPPVSPHRPRDHLCCFVKGKDIIPCMHYYALLCITMHDYALLCISMH